MDFRSYLKQVDMAQDLGHLCEILAISQLNVEHPDVAKGAFQKLHHQGELFRERQIGSLDFTDVPRAPNDYAVRRRLGA